MTGWRRVCEVMARAGVRGPHASPKGLRHGFGVAAVTAGVPLNLVQKWLGHAQLSTTAIYADAVGEEEHAIAARMWCSQEQHHPRTSPTTRIRDAHEGACPPSALLGSVEMRTSACWHHNPSRKCREERAMM
jgi:Phage integrase family